MNKILVIAAHPDDEVLGCGGMIARMEDVFVFFLGAGRQGEEKENSERIYKVSNILRFDFSIDGDYPDNQFDKVPLLEMVQNIEELIEHTKPDTIFTHYRNDLNIDHRIAYQATITAARPKGEVKEIYSYEIPTSTNWGFPISFSPDFFIDISDTVGRKIQAYSIYTSEVGFMRDADTIKTFSFYRGQMCGLMHAEAFETVRRVI